MNRKVSEKRWAVNWLKTQWIKLEKSRLNLIQFKNDYNEESDFYAIKIGKSAVGRPVSLKNINQLLLYPNG